jgi:hypothetical protein
VRLKINFSGHYPDVRRFGRLSLILAAIGLLWAGFAYTVSRPTTPADYRRTLLQVAEATHDAARTGWLTGREQLAGRSTAPFTATGFDDATRAAAGASRQFAEEAPPDAATRKLRDQVSPLVSEVVNRLADASAADATPEGTALLREAVDRLDKAAGDLEPVIEELR